jgi:hypothetical protein
MPTYDDIFGFAGNRKELHDKRCELLLKLELCNLHLTEAEALLLCKVQGAGSYFGTVENWQVSLRASFADYVQEEVRWGGWNRDPEDELHQQVNPQDLLGRLQKAPLAAQLALTEACEKFWDSLEDQPEVTDTERLKLAGFPPGAGVATATA